MQHQNLKANQNRTQLHEHFDMRNSNLPAATSVENWTAQIDWFNSDSVNEVRLITGFVRVT